MKYLFYIAKAYSIPIIKPLVTSLKSSGREYGFYISENVDDNFPDEWDQNRILKDLKKAKKFNADFVLCPGNFVDFRIPGIKVQLFHGLGVEKDVHYDIRHFFDVYLTSGPYVTERFETLRQKNKYFILLQTGWSKVDYILNYPADKLKQKFSIPDNKKIILYAPTFSKQHESATALLDVIPEIMKDDEFWLFKFHELMDRDIVRRFEQIEPGKSRVLQDAEITPYLHIADVMISDTSSVVYEFMLLDKPVITFHTQAREDKGINILEPAELRPALDRSLANPREFQECRKRHLQEINPALDGKISDRAIEQLEKVKTQNLLSGKRKPLNLFRKAQIIYHGIFRKGYLR